MFLRLIIRGAIFALPVVGVDYLAYRVNGYVWSAADFKWHKTDKRIDSYIEFNKQLVKDLFK